MGKVNNLTGRKFGRLTVAKRAENKGTHAMWLCKCDCGKEKIVSGSDLLSEKTKSCGCYHKEKVISMNTTHGMSNTRLHKIWFGMKARCFNENNEKYENYGGRGITICPEWIGENGFYNFAKWAYDNGYDENAERGEYTIERKDNNKGYSPENCRWATYKEQANNKRNSKRIEYNGEIHTLSEWSDILEKDYSTIWKRIKKLGWSVEKAFETPIRKLDKK